MSFTTTDFLNSVRMRGSIPTTNNSNNVNNTANLLAMATEELHIKLLPLIMSAREELYVARKEYGIQSGQAYYQIPTRASGMVVRDVQRIEGSSVYSVLPLDSDQITTTSTGSVQGYYLEHNNVVLYPTPSATSGTLRIRYYLRPSRLAATTACAQIQSINTTNNTIDVTSVPSTWGTDTIVDFIKKSSPHSCPAIDVPITGVSGTTISFDELPADLEKGDWVALADYSPIPQVPVEFRPVLAQMTVVKALEAIGDREGAYHAFKDIEKLQENALTMITPRSHSDPKKVIVRNWR